MHWELLCFFSISSRSSTLFPPWFLFTLLMSFRGRWLSDKNSLALSPHRKKALVRIPAGFFLCGVCVFSPACVGLPASSDSVCGRLRQGRASWVLSVCHFVPSRPEGKQLYSTAKWWQHTVCETDIVQIVSQVMSVCWSRICSICRCFVTFQYVFASFLAVCCVQFERIRLSTYKCVTQNLRLYNVSEREHRFTL